MNIAQNPVFGFGFRPKALHYPIVDRISFYPNPDNVSRIVGCGVYGSNTSPTANLVLLYTIPSASAGWNTQYFTNTVEYKYLLVKGNNTAYSGDVAEMQFNNGAGTIPKLSTFGDNWYLKPSTTFDYTKPFDGNGSTLCLADSNGNVYYGIEVAPV